MRKLFILTSVILFPLFANAQSEAELIWGPELSYSWSSSDRVSYNTKLVAFNNLRELGNQAGLVHIEPSFVMTYSLTTRYRIAGGYVYRWSDPLLDGYNYEHRFLQQLGFVSYIGDRRVAHRVRLEQRIRSSSYQNRLRYRLSYDFPLQGERLDPGEKYFIVNNETMTAFNAEEADAENRITAGLGWYFNNQYKFEVNLQYRMQDIFSGDGLSHMVLFGTSFYINR
jgi:hypothetical protein